MRKLFLLALCTLVLVGCFDDPSDHAQQAQSKDPQFKTGLSSFSGLYTAARMWSGDAEPVKLQSKDVQGFPAKDGKALVWRGVFASPQKGSLRAYTWSGIENDDAPPRGITPGGEDSYNPANVSTKILPVNALRTDSDTAFSVAQQHGGKAILAKAPNTPVRFELSGDKNAEQAKWIVSYGPNPDEPQLKVAVDCVSGNFLGVLK